LQRLADAAGADGHVSRMERQRLRDEVALLDGEVERLMSNGRRY